MYDAQFYRTRTDFGCLGNFFQRRHDCILQEVLYETLPKPQRNQDLSAKNNRENEDKKKYPWRISNNRISKLQHQIVHKTRL